MDFGEHNSIIAGIIMLFVLMGAVITVMKMKEKRRKKWDDMKSEQFKKDQKERNS